MLGPFCPKLSVCSGHIHSMILEGVMHPFYRWKTEAWRYSGVVQGHTAKSMRGSELKPGTPHIHCLIFSYQPLSVNLWWVSGWAGGSHLSFWGPLLLRRLKLMCGQRSPWAPNSWWTASSWPGLSAENTDLQVTCGNFILVNFGRQPPPRRT